MKTPEYEKRMSSKVQSWLHGSIRDRPSKNRISLCVVKRRLVLVKMIEEDIAILGLLPHRKPSALQTDLVKRLPDSSGNIPPLLLGQWVGNQVSTDRRLHWHSWRNYFILRRLDANESLQRIMQWTGHDSEALVIHYAKAKAKEKEGIARFN